MMKHFLILLCALVLAQGLKEEEVISRNPFEKDADLLEPFLKEYFELQYLIHLIQEIEQYQQTQKISSLAYVGMMSSLPPHYVPPDTPFSESLDSDACNILTKSLAKAVNLAQDINNWAYQAGLKIWDKFTNLMHCANINPITAFKCVINDFNELKEFIKVYKSDLLNYKHEMVELAKELKVEFKQCLREQKQAQVIAE